jgi:hypothetical protein
MVETMVHDIKNGFIGIIASSIVGGKYLKKNWDKEDTEVVLKGFGCLIFSYAFLVVAFIVGE